MGEGKGGSGLSEPKHTPGPRKVLKTSWENSLICAEDGTLIAICKIHADVTEDTQDEFEKIKDLNADLLTNAWQLPDLRRDNTELKAIIKEMISTIDSSTLCRDCMDKGVMCSECPWAQARDKGKEWTAKEESE